MGGGRKLNMTISKVNLRNVVIAVIIAKMETTFNLALSIFFLWGAVNHKWETLRDKMRVEKRERERVNWFQIIKSRQIFLVNIKYYSHTYSIGNIPKSKSTITSLKLKYRIYVTTACMRIKKVEWIISFSFYITINLAKCYFLTFNILSSLNGVLFFS